jgi:tripartite-type tricarboxylate transporter receptor subunit TctC
MTLLRREFLMLAGASAVCSPSMAFADGYPARPVRVLVPYAPSGPSDILARLVAQKLAEQLGKPFYVENVSGAGGNIGLGQAAKAAPDGHTVVVVPPNIVVNPSMYEKVPYEQKDFAPVTVAVRSPIVLSVHPSVPARSVKELVALIRAGGSKYSFASPGTATPPHLIGELFRLALGLDMVHVPFNSAGPAVTATVAGHTPIVFASLPPAVPQIKEGNLRALAVTSPTRSPALPDVPTMTEAGYPEVDGEGWFAFIVPAGTPKDVIDLLHREIAKAVAQPDVQDKMGALGFLAVDTTPQQAADLFRAEGAKWSKVIREAGIKAN